MVSMTTERQPFSRRPSQSAHQKRSAVRSTCPKCGRQQSLKHHSDDLMYGSYCRREDCDYEHFTVREFE
jgi:hypothetical protein